MFTVLGCQVFKKETVIWSLTLSVVAPVCKRLFLFYELVLDGRCRSVRTILSLLQKSFLFVSVIAVAAVPLHFVPCRARLVYRTREALLESS